MVVKIEKTPLLKRIYQSPIRKIAPLIGAAAGLITDLGISFWQFRLSLVVAIPACAVLAWALGRFNGLLVERTDALAESKQQRSDNEKLRKKTVQLNGRLKASKEKLRDLDDLVRAESGKHTSSSDLGRFFSGVRQILPEPTLESELRRLKTVNLNRFVFKKKLGEGAAGKVFLVYDTEMRRTIVIKVLKQFESNPQFLRRSIDEIYSLSSLGQNQNISPNIAIVYEAKRADQDNTISYQEAGDEKLDVIHKNSIIIMMEHVDGKSLENYLTRISQIEALDIVIKLMNVLKHVHMDGIVHRDLKPENIIIPEKADKSLFIERLKLLDFGLAKNTEDQDRKITQAFDIAGTPEFMSPDQWGAFRDVTPASDIFSVGMLLYTMLTKKFLFGEYSGDAHLEFLERVNKTDIGQVIMDNNVPFELKGLLIAMLERKPEDRTTNHDLIIQDLEEAKKIMLGANPATIHTSRETLLWREEEQDAQKAIKLEDEEDISTADTRHVNLDEIEEQLE